MTVLIFSDWKLLNDSSTKRLQRILTNMYHLTAEEIEQACQLLASYHAVCRKEHSRKILATEIRIPCKAPTEEQLSHIADLQRRANWRINQNAVLTHLQKIADHLREYKIATQGGNIHTLSLDTSPEIQTFLEKSQITEDNDTEKFNFIEMYREQFIESLDKAISQTIENFILNLQHKHHANQKITQSFLTGLYLFHCQGKAMSQIAYELGMQQQYQVTRLLKLKQLRRDIYQRMLKILHERVLQIAQQFIDHQHLQNLEGKLESILGEQIFEMIQEAESEARNPIRNQSLSNIFTHRLCHYLNHQRHQSNFNY
ncbi:MAG: hypothetical protein AAF378_16240 [Cyanobacteria bacterium P01_A01_bin.84]